uniref:Uncharacterized protein n=1 Tax=Anopheles dirus TaxID=7168 RepID=A0A182NZ45_9DIPT
MFKLNPQDPTAVMPLAKCLLNLSGFRQDTPQHRRAIFLNLFVFITVVFIPKTCFPYPDTETLIRSLGELIFFANVCMGFYCLTLQQSHYRELLDNIETFVNAVYRSEYSPQQEKLITVNRKIQKLSAMLCYYVALSAVIFWLVPCLMTYRSLYIAAATPNGSDTSAHFYQILDATFYWLDNRQSVVGYVIYSVIIVLALYFASYNYVAKLCTIFSSIKYCSILLQLVGLGIAKLDDIPTETTEREMKKIVQMHNIALRCATLVERMVNPVMALQFALSLLTWSLVLLYTVLVGFDVNVLNGCFIMCNMTMEMYGYCFLGTELATTGANIARQSYQFQWEQHSPAVQRMVQMVMVRSQKPFQITAGGLITVNVEQFAKAVRTSYSVLILLKDLI